MVLQLYHHQHHHQEQKHCTVMSTHQATALEQQFPLRGLSFQMQGIAHTKKSPTIGTKKQTVPNNQLRAMMVVKWSACSPSTLTIRVRIPLTSAVFSVKSVFEKNENKQNRQGLAHFLKICLNQAATTTRLGRTQILFSNRQC